MKIHYSDRFKKEYCKLPYIIKLKAERKENFFRDDPFSPVLETFRLQGSLKDYLLFSIDKNYKIIFEFRPKDTVWFHLVFRVSAIILK